MNLNGLRAKITVPNVPNMLRTMSLSSRGPHATAAKAIVKEWADNGWLNGDEKLPNLPEIRWKEELKHHSNWFKVARWPFLKDSRFYLRGVNYKGEDKPTSPPEDGWLEGEAPMDWVPLED